MSTPGIFQRCAAVASATFAPLRKLIDDRRGNVAVTFGVMAVPLVALVGISLDYSSAAGLRVGLQAAVDSAVLAAGKKGIADGDRVTVATRQFNALVPDQLKPYVTASSFQLSTGNAQITGTATVVVPAKFGMLTTATQTIELKATAASKVAKAVVRQLDLVFCIDATGSMQNTIDAVKANALSFETNLNNALAARGIDRFEAMRIRVIYFRDYGGDTSYPGYYLTGPSWNRTRVYDSTRYGDNPPLNASDFFKLPTDQTAFSSFVNAQSASGGGDIPESGLVCVNKGIDSPWATVGSTLTWGTASGKTLEAVFPTIVVWTDAPAHDPDHWRSLQNSLYPPATEMPRTYTDLEAKWNNPAEIDQTNKLLVFFGAPDNYMPNYPSDDGWYYVKRWNNFMLGGTLTEGTTQLVNKLADAIASKAKMPTLSQ